jgi:hypothetical protein
LVLDGCSAHGVEADFAYGDDAFVGCEAVDKGDGVGCSFG